jgi:hypothetical protein
LSLRGVVVVAVVVVGLGSFRRLASSARMQGSPLARCQRAARAARGVLRCPSMRLPSCSGPVRRARSGYVRIPYWARSTRLPVFLGASPGAASVGAPSTPYSYSLRRPDVGGRPARRVAAAGAGRIDGRRRGRVGITHAEPQTDLWEKIFRCMPAFCAWLSTWMRFI